MDSETLKKKMPLTINNMKRYDEELGKRKNSVDINELISSGRIQSFKKNTPLANGASNIFQETEKQWKLRESFTKIAPPTHEDSKHSSWYKNDF